MATTLPFVGAFNALLNCQAAMNGGKRLQATIGETQPITADAFIEGENSDPGLGVGAWNENGETMIQMRVSDFPTKPTFQSAVTLAGRTGLYLKSYVESNGVYRMTIADRTKKK